MTVLRFPTERAGTVRFKLGRKCRPVSQSQSDSAGDLPWHNYDAWTHATVEFRCGACVLFKKPTRLGKPVGTLPWPKLCPVCVPGSKLPRGFKFDRVLKIADGQKLIDPPRRKKRERKW